MRGRKPRPLVIVAHDIPILQQIARSRSLPWYQVQRAQILVGVAAGGPIHQLAVRTQCDPSTIWRVCRRYECSGLPDLLAPPQRPGRPARISPCNGLRSSDWRAWSRSPRDCTSLTGPARIWPAKRSRMVSFLSSAIERFETFSAMSTFSRIALGIGRHLESTPISRSVPKRSPGATLMLSDWPSGVSG